MITEFYITILNGISIKIRWTVYCRFQRQKQFETQLEKLARRYFPESKQINLFETEFLFK